jgi:hypothetical protein
VIGGGNFADRPTVLLMLLAASLVSTFVVMVAAGEFGRRAKPAAEGAPESVSRERVLAGHAGGQP